VSDSVSVPTGNGNVTRVSVNLMIPNASREDTGVYTCSANNSIGSDNRSVSITVQCKFILNAWNPMLKIDSEIHVVQRVTYIMSQCSMYVHLPVL